MANLFIIGIGGTGARVLKSLTMLLTAGVKPNNVDTIYPIIIDKDNTNGDVVETASIVSHYINARNTYKEKGDKHGENTFFSTKVEVLGDLQNQNPLLLQLTDQNNSLFSDYINFVQLSVKDKALAQVLYSQGALAMNTSEGFHGVPSIGSIVLNQFVNNPVFQNFAGNFGQNDKIFIISSIFGGTGASGFPLLVKTLRHALPTNIKNRDFIIAAPIGAISVLPYFTLMDENMANEDDENEVKVDSNTFIAKAKAALFYYKDTLCNGNNAAGIIPDVDSLYFIGDKRTSEYPYFPGGANQNNPAHLVEMFAALAIINFMNRGARRPANEHSAYYCFGLKNDGESINFTNLDVDTLNIIRNPLIKFQLFAKYMASVFKGQKDYQPWSKKKNYSFDQSPLQTCMTDFMNWLIEMGNKEYEVTIGNNTRVYRHAHRFVPFNLASPSIDCINDVDLPKNYGGFRRLNEWAWLDNELNKADRSVDNKINKDERLLEIFHQATKNFVQRLINEKEINKKDK